MAPRPASRSRRCSPPCASRDRQAGRPSSSPSSTSPAAPSRHHRDAHPAPADAPEAAAEARAARGVLASRRSISTSAPGARQQRRPPDAQPVRRQNTIAVASGKGGVGKSTVAVNLAVALAQGGAKVGLLDTDVYGPSAPLMMGVNDRPLMRDNKIIPLEAHGVKVMSIGFIMDPDKALIWRGPLVAQLITQFLNDVHWGDLDYLVLDLPPGTGDVQLTLVQKIPISGAVIVTTPQEVALADAVKGLKMFDEVKTPVLGIVENMSGLSAPAVARHIRSLARWRQVADDNEVELLRQSRSSR